MRLQIYFTALLLATSLAHNLKAQSLSYGPEIGPNIIWLDEDYTGHYYTMGWHVGGFAEYALNKFFSIRSGVYYTEKKQQYTRNEVSVNPIIQALGAGIEGIDQLDINTYTNTNGRVTQNYFEIPVMARLKYSGFAVSAGLQTSFMFRSNTKEIVTTNTPIFTIINSLAPGGVGGFFPPATSLSETTSSSKTGLKTLDWGAKFGLSYQVKRVELSATFYAGFMDYTSSSDIARRHQYFQTTVCYHLGASNDNQGLWKSNKLK